MLKAAINTTGPHGEKLNAEMLKAEMGEQAGLLTRGGVAVVLGVSVRTVDRMKAAGEIKAVTLRGWSVRFDRAEVMEAVRKGNRKFGRKAEMGKDTDCTGNSQSPIADRRGGRDTNYGKKLKAEIGKDTDCADFHEGGVGL